MGVRRRHRAPIHVDGSSRLSVVRDRLGFGDDPRRRYGSMTRQHFDRPIQNARPVPLDWTIFEVGIDAYADFHVVVLVGLYAFHASSWCRVGSISGFVLIPDSKSGAHTHTNFSRLG